MDLWKPAVRKAKKVNISGGVDKSGATLPDVVAGLTLSESQHSAMLGTRDHHYHDMSENRPRRRDARPPPPPVTPQGLGAAPQGLGAAPSQSMSPNGGGGGGPWRHNTQHQWTGTMDPSGVQMSPGLGVGGQVGGQIGLGGCSGMPLDSESSRVRSVSSEPRGPGGNGGDRRVRCSSASRSRQHRPRPTPDHPPPATSPPLMPAMQTGGHGAQQPYPPPVGLQQGSGMVGGVLARLTGCYETLDPGRESGDGVAYGYQVSDLEALLTRASPSRPANLPMVLASATRLHNMRRTPEPRPQNQPPVRPFLPLGIIVNAVFKTRDWLYVRTAHGAEGYVPYRVCLPLGILPPPREGHTVSPHADMTGTAVWDSRTDMFQGGLSQLASSPVVPVGAMSVAEGTGGQTRGRPRARRRPPCPDACNQTDTQKLQPASAATRSLSESRPPRESLDSPPLAANTLAPTPLAQVPVAPTPTTALPADHVLV